MLTISILFLLFAYSTQLTTSNPNPICYPTTATGNETATRFVFFIDRSVEQTAATRIIYLMKSISCEIPKGENLMSVLIETSLTETNYSPLVNSMDLPEHMANNDFDKTTEYDHKCERFVRCLRNLSPSVLDHENVQFIIPIIEEGTNCSYLKEFQNHFAHHPRKENVFFNGLLINQTATKDNQQAIRVNIPDIMVIDPNKPSLVSSERINDVIGSAPMVQDYATMIKKILSNDTIRDWGIGYTLPQTTTTTVAPNTTTVTQTSTVTRLDLENSTTTTTRSENLTTSTVGADLEASTTTSEASTTIKDHQKVAIEDEDKAAKKKEEIKKPVVIDPALHRKRVNVFFFLIITTLVVWIFLIFICLTCMIVFGTNKKQTGAERPLLNRHRQEMPPASSASAEQTDDDDAEAWRRIRPGSQEVASGSMKEVPKMAPAQYDPVEVSQTEKSNIETEGANNHPPRHGYKPMRKPADLSFE